MPEDKLVGLRLEGNLSGLCSSTVVCLLGKEGVLGGEGGFVIETSDIMEQFCQLGTIGGVGTIGVGTDWVRWRGEMVVRDERAVFCCPIHTSLDVVDL